MDRARKEFKDSDAALDKATAEHALASDRHQEDRDDLATAQSMETKNEPVFEVQYQRSKAAANQVFAEEMEILDSKKVRGDFYQQQRREPEHQQIHRWLYAGVVNPADVPCLTDSGQGLICAGDWCLGNDIDSALASGNAAALQTLKILG